MIERHHLTRRFSKRLTIAGCLAIALAAATADAGVAWHESYAAAQAASQSSQRPVLVVFTATWCEACQHLDSRLWANQEASALVSACYEPVLVDVDTDPAFARRMGISHIPAACILNSNDQLLSTFDVPPTAASFVAQAARALHESTATAVAPPTTITSRFPQDPPQQAAATMPARPAPNSMPAPNTTAMAAPQAMTTGSRYDGATSRYAQRPTSSFAGGATTAGPPQQQPTRTAIDPAPQTLTAAPTQPWLADGQGYPATQPAETAPTVAPQQQMQMQYQQQGQQGGAMQGYPLQPQAPPSGWQAGSSASQTMTPYPTPPPQLDSAATATDREAAEESKKSKSSFLASLQKPFSFMMPKQESDPADASQNETATTPSPYPVGLDGYCPVTLAEQASWTEGRAQWGVQHRGRTYLFASATEQQRFLANPDRYAPALSGDDVVLAFEGGNQIPGQRRYGVTYQGRIYLFSSLETRSRFAANPQAYASRVRLAESPGAGGGTMLR